jgi:thermostable 8-oxoguanine DNA glycosylase
MKSRSVYSEGVWLTLLGHTMIHTAQDCKDSLSEYLKRFKFQPDLTAHLDNLPDEPFSQETVNEIVLWKVNRYARLPQDVRDSLYSLRRLSANEHLKAEHVLLNLLRCDGVDLPMASTFLRFQNAEVFQIVDRHAYRAAIGEPYPLHSATPTKTKVSTYFTYLDALHSLAASSGAAFRDLDRILYVFDKQHNGTLSEKVRGT